MTQAPHPQALQANQQQMAAAQQHFVMQNSIMQQRREGVRGQCLFKLIQFSEHLSNFPVRAPFMKSDAFVS